MALSDYISNIRMEYEDGKEYVLFDVERSQQYLLHGSYKLLVPTNWLDGYIFMVSPEHDKVVCSRLLIKVIQEKERENEETKPI